MWYFLCGLGGVLLGALISAAIFLYVLQRCVDRDLIERRLRAYLEYGDRLGDISRFLASKGAPDSIDVDVFRQAWKNVAAFCREFRLTSWLLPPRERKALGDIVTDFEREMRAYDTGSDLFKNASSLPIGSLAQKTADRQKEIERILRQAVRRQVRQYRRFRFLPGVARPEKDDEHELTE
jgi:hypothetical protein